MMTAGMLGWLLILVGLWFMYVSLARLRDND
jgi:hypothetical protein